MIWKHAVKNALHPLVAALGQTLAWLINGFMITSIVLDLPTIQTVYLNATLQQDVFLGLGIRPPMTSWGLLLNEAQHTRVLIQQPGLLTPAVFVVATIISFNFLGDGLRDAADPFAN